MGIANTSSKFKFLPDALRNERLRQNFLQALPFWIASLITGLIAVYYAKLFLWAENLGASAIHIHSWYIFIISPVCFVLAWWIVKRFSTYARGSGIPQVMAAIELANPKDDHQIDKLLNIKMMIVKVVSSVFMIIGGAAIGREGPTIQIAGTVFRKINQWLPKNWPKISRKNMILTGAAAGLAAAFNTPLGGIVFAVEELAKTHISYFKTAIFTAVIIAGLTAQGLLGPYLYLGYPDVDHLSSLIFFAVILVALVSGLAGALMSQAILWVMRWKTSLKYKHSELLYVIACAVIVSLIAFFINDGMLGSGKEQMSQILFTSNKNVRPELPLLRTIGPILAFTTGGAGGVFAPSLGAGATIGALLAQLMQFTAANANLLVLSGMVGFLTGVTRSPFTSAILVLEMTDRHSVIFHLMLAATTASLASNIVSKHSLYDHLKHQYIEKLHKEDIAEGISGEQVIAVDSGSEQQNEG